MQGDGEAVESDGDAVDPTATHSNPDTAERCAKRGRKDTSESPEEDSQEGDVDEEAGEDDCGVMADFECPGTPFETVPRTPVPGLNLDAEAPPQVANVPPMQASNADFFQKRTSSKPPLKRKSQPTAAPASSQKAPVIAKQYSAKKRCKVASKPKSKIESGASLGFEHSIDDGPQSTDSAGTKEYQNVLQKLRVLQNREKELESRNAALEASVKKMKTSSKRSAVAFEPPSNSALNPISPTGDFHATISKSARKASEKHSRSSLFGRSENSPPFPNAGGSKSSRPQPVPTFSGSARKLSKRDTALQGRSVTSLFKVSRANATEPDPVSKHIPLFPLASTPATKPGPKVPSGTPPSARRSFRVKQENDEIPAPHSKRPRPKVLSNDRETKSCSPRGDKHLSKRSPQKSECAGPVPEGPSSVSASTNEVQTEPPQSNNEGNSGLASRIARLEQGYEVLISRNSQLQAENSDLLAKVARLEAAAAEAATAASRRVAEEDCAARENSQNGRGHHAARPQRETSAVSRAQPIGHRHSHSDPSKQPRAGSGVFGAPFRNGGKNDTAQPMVINITTSHLAMNTLVPQDPTERGTAQSHAAPSHHNPVFSDNTPSPGSSHNSTRNPQPEQQHPSQSQVMSLVKPSAQSQTPYQSSAPRTHNQQSHHGLPLPLAQILDQTAATGHTGLSQAASNALQIAAPETADQTRDRCNSPHTTDMQGLQRLIADARQSSENLFETAVVPSRSEQTPKITHKEPNLVSPESPEGNVEIVPHTAFSSPNEVPSAESIGPSRDTFVQSIEQNRVVPDHQVGVHQHNPTASESPAVQQFLQSHATSYQQTVPVVRVQTQERDALRSAVLGPREGSFLSRLTTPVVIPKANLRPAAPRSFPALKWTDDESEGED